MKTTILFDLDGTLIDSTDAILESFGFAFDSFGQSVPDDELIKAQIGYTLEDIFTSLGVDEGRVVDFVAAYKSKYREISSEKTYLIENAKEAIELASEFAALGIVTTKTSRYSKELLEHLGVMSYFEVLIGREDVENVKPHPEPIFKALDKMGRNDAFFKQNSWMIGDTFLDVNAAKNAGIKHVALMTGYGDKNHLQALSDIFSKDAFEAVKIIKNNYL